MEISKQLLLWASSVQTLFKFLVYFNLRTAGKTNCKTACDLIYIQQKQQVFCNQCEPTCGPLPDCSHALLNLWTLAPLQITLWTLTSSWGSFNRRLFCCCCKQTSMLAQTIWHWSICCHESVFLISWLPASPQCLRTECICARFFGRVVKK